MTHDCVTVRSWHSHFQRSLISHERALGHSLRHRPWGTSKFRNQEHFCVSCFIFHRLKTMKGKDATTCLEVGNGVRHAPVTSRHSNFSAKHHWNSLETAVESSRTISRVKDLVWEARATTVQQGVELPTQCGELRLEERRGAIASCAPQDGHKERKSGDPALSGKVALDITHANAPPPRATAKPLSPETPPAPTRQESEPFPLPSVGVGTATSSITN